MHKIIQREITETVIQRLKNNLAVALLRARQVGKSTIAEIVIKEFTGAIRAS